MDVVVSIEVDDSDAQSFFNYAGYHARDMRDPLEDVLHLIIGPGIVEQFEENPPGGHRAGGWLPLKESYLAAKVAGGYDHRTLIRTDAMRAELIADIESARVTKDELHFIATDPKVPYHQYGRSGGGRGGVMPARPIVVWTHEDDEKATAIFELWLDRLREANARRGAVDSSLRPSSFLNVSVAGFDF